MESAKIAFGMDVGYGGSKGVTDAGDILFPSLLGPWMQKTFRLNSNPEQEETFTVDIGTERFVVGPEARDMNVPISQDMSRDWLNSKNYKAFVTCLLREAVKKQGLDAKICPAFQIVTGLPVGYMSSADKEKCEQVIRGAAARLGLKVAEVDIVPQPIGTFLNIVTDHDGNLDIPANMASMSRIAIADIGYNTADIAVIEDFTNYIEADSGSLPIGAHNCFELLADALKSKHMLDHVGIRTAEEVARTKAYLLKGSMHDESATVNRVLAEVGHQVKSRILTLWKGKRPMDGIIITGGGGELLMPYLVDIGTNVIKADASQMANARGYYKRARLLLRRDVAA